jgi:hypothetical protein
MEDKYYTPSIDEFCVGFEFEYTIPYEEESYINIIYQTNESCDKSLLHNLSVIKREASIRRLSLLDYISFTVKNNPHLIRVKYLDKEDIEELGFEHTGGAMVKNSLDEFTIDYKDPRGTYDKVSILYTYGSKWCLIVQGDYETPHPDWPTRFAGYIKNKSELKQVLKMLNINA